jgi:hypothetical protein
MDANSQVLQRSRFDGGAAVAADTGSGRVDQRHQDFEMRIYQQGVPFIQLRNTAASAVVTTAATLNGTLSCPGAVYGVLACWNTVNGGTNAALWTNSAYVGCWTNLVSTNLSYTAAALLPARSGEPVNATTERTNEQFSVRRIAEPTPTGLHPDRVGAGPRATSKRIALKSLRTSRRN